VTVTCNGRTLTKGTDYTLDYRNNKAIGTGYVYIYGTGNYTGSMIKTFKILGKDISSLTGTLSQTSYKYTGLENKPTVTLYDGTTKLTLGTDYTVAYKDNKNCGTATVTITGKGNYSGTKTLNFTIVGQEQTLTTKYNIYSKTLSSKAFDLGASTDGTASSPTAQATHPLQPFPTRVSSPSVAQALPTSPSKPPAMPSTTRQPRPLRSKSNRQRRRQL
jgi:hypothetical protein